jgi:hypothetical protein
MSRASINTERIAFIWSALESEAKALAEHLYRLEVDAASEIAV